MAKLDRASIWSYTTQQAGVMMLDSFLKILGPGEDYLFWESG
jgi:hypothetical protein